MAAPISAFRSPTGNDAATNHLQLPFLESLQLTPSDNWLRCSVLGNNQVKNRAPQTPAVVALVSTVQARLISQSSSIQNTICYSSMSTSLMAERRHYTVHLMYFPQ